MADRTVNERQLEVLKWIVAGCPNGVMTDNTHKTTAVALQNRHLVTVTKRRGNWNADATDAGRYYAEHGAYPTSSTAPAAKIHAGQQPKSQPKPKPKPQPQPQPSLSRTTNPETPTVPHQPPPQAIPASVPVPARLSSRPHPVVTRIKKENLLPFKPELRGRALRILDTLAKEAERRGHKVEQPSLRRGYSRTDHLFVVSVRGHPTTIALREPSTRSDHVLTPEEARRKERTGYDWAPRYDYTPSGRLRLVVDGYGEQFTEPKNGKWTLEDRLHRVFDEIEGRAAAAEAREAERQREQAERQARWETVRAEAEIALTEHHRASVLMTEAAQWQQHRMLREYIGAMEAHIADLPPEDAATAAEWLRWSQAHHARLAPFQHLRMPSPPDPAPDALKPFMKGHNPYGPGW